MFKIRDKMEFSYKIGIVGPSGSGKTTLIMACYMAFRTLLKGSVDIKPQNTLTEEMLKNAEFGFKSCIAHKERTWEPPRFHPTDAVQTYEFPITFQMSNQTHTVNLTVMDYPGGMLGSAEFSKQFTPFLLECNALFLPIPADILMEWYKNKGDVSEDAQRRCLIAREMLCVESACNVVDNWMATKARNRQPAQLFFVPIRCEKYFSDNTETSSTANNSIFSYIYNSTIKPMMDAFTSEPQNALINAVDDVYYQQLRYTSGEAEYVSIITTCVDTYGIVEECQIDVRGDKLVPQFKRREGMGRVIRIKNAYELLTSVFKFQLDKERSNLIETVQQLKDKIENSNKQFEELKKKRTFWESVWGNTPQMNIIQNEIKSFTDKMNQNNTRLSVIKTFLDKINSRYNFNKQRTKTYDPEKE